MKYPAIKKPQKSGRVWKIEVVKGPGESKLLTYLSKKAATEGYAALDVARELLVPRGQPEIANVRGPYHDKTAGGRWVLRWTEDGEARALSNTDRAIVAAKKQELVPSKSKTDLPSLKRFKGTAKEFRKAIASAVVSLNAAAIEGDEGKMATLRKYIAGLRDMAAAIVPHSGYIELEQEHAALTAFVEALYAGRAAIEDASKPAALKDPASTIQGGEEQDPALPGSGGGLPN